MKKNVTDGPRDDNNISWAFLFVPHHFWTLGSGV